MQKISSYFVWSTVPLKPAGPSICHRGQDIGFIRRVGEALVKEGSSLTPISEWKPTGLEPAFPANFFVTKKKFSIEDMLTVSKRGAEGNQNDFADGTCFVLPIRAYERNFTTGVRVVRTSDARDCLSFEANSPDVVFEAQWFSGDDFDLSVIEPDGNDVSSANRVSECGTLSNDNNVDGCDRHRRKGAHHIHFRLP